MDENIFVAPKMHNNYGAIQLFIIPIWPYSNIGLFSIAPCKVITLIFFCFIFGISSLLLSFISLSIVILLLIAIAFKGVKERQLNRKQYRNEGLMQIS